VEAPTPSEAANYSIDLAHLAQFDESRTAIADTVPSAAEQFLNSFSESAYAPGVRSGLKRYLMARIRRDLATDSERAIFERLFAGGTEARVRFDAARSKARQSR